MITRQRIRAEQAVRDFAKRGTRKFVRAVLCNSAGAFDVVGRVGYVYARLLRNTGKQLVEVHNSISIQRIPDLPILLEATAHGYELIGIDNEYVDNPFANTVGSHAPQHIIGSNDTGGFDGLPVYNAAMVNLRVRAQLTPDMTVHVEEGFHLSGGLWQYFPGGDSAAFTAPSAGNGRIDLVCVDATNAIQIIAGTESATPTYPVPTSDVTVLGAIAFVETDIAIPQTMIEAGNVTAVPMATGGTGGGASGFNASIAFGDASPVTIYTVPAGQEIDRMSVYVFETWDGAGADVTIKDGMGSDVFAAGEFDLTREAIWDKKIINSIASGLIVAITPGSGASQGQLRIQGSATASP